MNPITASERTKIVNLATELLQISLFLENCTAKEILSSTPKSQAIKSYDNRCWFKLGRVLKDANFDWVSVVAFDVSRALGELIGERITTVQNKYSPSKPELVTSRTELLKNWCLRRPMSFLYTIEQIKYLNIAPEINLVELDSRLQAVSAALYERTVVEFGTGFEHYDAYLNSLESSYLLKGDTKDLFVYNVEEASKQISNWFWFDERKCSSQPIELDEASNLPAGYILNVLTGENQTASLDSALAVH